MSATPALRSQSVTRRSIIARWREARGAHHGVGRRTILSARGRADHAVEQVRQEVPRKPDATTE